MQATISQLLCYSRDANIEELCSPQALGSDGLKQIESLPMRERQLQRGELLFRQGHGLHSLYLVTRGGLKTAILDSEGRMQIVGFHFPGELLGLDAFHTRAHICAASAMIASTVRVLPLHRLHEAMALAPVLHDTLERLLSKTLAEHEQLLMVVNRRTATTRVAILLFSLSCRLGQQGCAARELNLIMSRAELANYLGLTKETFSRAVRTLRLAGLVQGSGKRITIIDPDRLARCAVSGHIPL